MNNLSMALKNLKKNFSFYALYLLSVSFVITVFFAFTSFSMNTVMLEKISGNGRVEMMCNVISVFLMAFVVFYMSYSNRFFLRRRTKELGVYALLGYRKTTVLSLLTTENLLVCFGAFIVGILLGSFFHKGIVFGITKLLDLSINNSKIPFFNVNAISKTACFIFAICYPAPLVLQIILISVKLNEGTDSDILMFFTAECLNRYLLVLSYQSYKNSRYLPDQSLTPAIITIRCTTTSLDREMLHQRYDNNYSTF